MTNKDSSEQTHSPHTGWTSRGYLPHFDGPDVVQGVTFRLGDALPIYVAQAMADDPKFKADEAHRAKVEAYLNACHGACYLRHPAVGKLVEDTLHYYDGHRYHLLAWVVMPNHVHVLIQTLAGFPLHDSVRSWKSYTAAQANRILERRGAFWYPDYFDRYIRSERHLAAAVAYIHDNPVKAGLVDCRGAWPFTSARGSEMR